MDLTSTISTLEAYKKLTDDEINHDQLLKEKTVILYVATLLDSKNKEVLNLCMDILDNFIKNNKAHERLTMTFGILEALESMSIEFRHGDYSHEAQRAAELLNTLRSSLSPTYYTRSKSKSKNTTLAYQLHIDGLTAENRHQLDETLVHTKGIISFMVDLERNRCAVRVGPNLSIKNLILKIHTDSGMKPYLIASNSDKIETLIDVLENKNIVSFPDNYPELDMSPTGSHTISTITSNGQNKGGWLKNISNFWTNSFYW